MVQSSAFTTSRCCHTSFVYNGYLYIIGGNGSGADLNDIQHCPINADGSVGTCVVQTTAFTTGRTQHTSVIYNGNLYIIGGHSGASTYYNDIQHLSIAALPQVAHYERVVDLGRVYDSVDSIQYNGTAPCGVKLQYATAGTNGIFGAPATVYEDSMPGITYALSNVTFKRYVRLTLSIDDQQCGGTSVITDVTVNSTLLPPAAPTLSQPAAAQTGVSTTPEFRMYTTDAASDYVRYKIDVCSTSNCSSIVRTIDETSSQIGWSSQSQQSATAYASGQTAIHTYQAVALSANTQYWWRAYAIDPAGANTFSAASSIGTFNTTPATQNNVNIGGGTTIYGGTTFGQ